MRVLVCGSRTLTDPWPLYALLNGLKRLNGPAYMWIISGGARGADAFAYKWASTNLPDGHMQVFAADWDAHGRAAGPIRNRRMLEDGKPDLVIAAVDKPLALSKGTADMVLRAREAGIQTLVLEDWS